MNILKKHISNLFFFIKNIVLFKINSGIRYRVVGFEEKTYIVSFQCDVTRAFFTKDILSTIYDEDIICQISPEQACYLGLMVGLGLREGKIKPPCDDNNELIFFPGNKRVDAPIIFDRYGNIIFSHPKSGKKCVIRSEHVISKRELINLFSPILACYVGIQVSYRKSLASATISKIPKQVGNHLKLVKNA